MIVLQRSFAFTPTHHPFLRYRPGRYRSLSRCILDVHPTQRVVAVCRIRVLLSYCASSMDVCFKERMLTYWDNLGSLILNNVIVTFGRHGADHRHGDVLIEFHRTKPSLVGAYKWGNHAGLFSI